MMVTSSLVRFGTTVERRGFVLTPAYKNIFISTLPRSLLDSKIGEKNVSLLIEKGMLRVEPFLDGKLDVRTFSGFLSNRLLGKRLMAEKILGNLPENMSLQSGDKELLTQGKEQALLPFSKEEEEFLKAFPVIKNNRDKNIFITAHRVIIGRAAATNLFEKSAEQSKTVPLWISRLQFEPQPKGFLNSLAYRLLQSPFLLEVLYS
ncbi:hypothetical protein A3J90_03435 [candidate division WOR-1 bacterium RIFOXYC2_FULL_37_10]|uniref:Uncharacterized protein n=1 Tax=candidate division WOR-1 bacterium RIFOXYB2_FULL_37_13 TaxID=1802579 RepID=A0A1F4SVE7_UNCSA|nr:MAG: hypothetical protein A2246_01075 [candidate division WOR-1 bacterium RIFOXYA2_FULL_37_7]OGC24411.1 MAG: hypothetical protein A2310_08380 [candidate division WOR-1 bacterium RIFOXYB2_FULL_37_13]OGC37493.1 MAG: hypothetical protein A3J90_03435 [candidate division WOR-1 bacterium RIFOXYC2_FULL_37_10]